MYIYRVPTGPGILEKSRNLKLFIQGLEKSRNLTNCFEVREKSRNFDNISQLFIYFIMNIPVDAFHANMLGIDENLFFIIMSLVNS